MTPQRDSMTRFRWLAALAVTSLFACRPPAGDDPLRRPSPNDWAERHPVSAQCAALVAERRTAPLAEGDSMPVPVYMDVGEAGTPGAAGEARFVVNERGLVEPATLQTTPALAAEPREKLIGALRDWRLLPARENGCDVAGWFIYAWGT